MLRSQFCVSALMIACLIGSQSFAQELPDEAKQVLIKHESEVATIRMQSEAELDAVRKKTDLQLHEAVEKAKKQLQLVQDKFTKAGKLDEALAIRDRIRTLALESILTLSPGASLTGYEKRIGESFLFEVTGAGNGAIYGSEIYTYDSPLDTAAVHSGALKFGEKGIVKVTILPGKSGYEASTAHDVTSRHWSSYEASYKV